MLQIAKFIVNPFEECTYVIYDAETSDAIVIDPGMLFDSERNEFDKFINEKKLNLRHIINTHLHLDHCFGANYVKDKYGVDVLAHADDAQLGLSLVEQSRRFGFVAPLQAVIIDHALNHGDTISVGNTILEVLHVPGHSAGGIALYCPSDNFVIVGDSLFKGSIGRTDLLGGDRLQLIKSIEKNLMTLPDETIVISGHGDPTTIGHERRSNPFLT